MMNKIITALLGICMSFTLIFCGIINVSALETDDTTEGSNEIIENTQMVELCQIDLSSNETQTYTVELPNGSLGTVIVEDVPTESITADHYTLSGTFNKRFTFTESSPLMTISAIYSGTVSSSSVSLNKPKDGRMSGLINYESGTYSTQTYSGDSKTKEAVFTAKYTLAGTTHYMDLILRVAPSSSKNNAVLYTNGTF